MTRNKIASAPGSDRFPDSGATRGVERQTRTEAAAERASNAAMVADDSPAWSDEQLDRAELAHGGEIVRPAKGTLTRGPGRPPAAHPKEHVSVRLDPDIIAALKAGGPGWQKRMNEMLRTALGLGRGGGSLSGAG